MRPADGRRPAFQSVPLALPAMKRAPLPADEKKRLEALRQYDVLDTPPEEAFDDLARLAAQIGAAPMALISLVDERRQWCKSRVGLTALEFSREISFCAHAILQSDLLIVPDATKDERFADNPLVVAEPRIRFYAGVPLVTSAGQALGTLCILDREPRELKPEQQQALRLLGRRVMSQLETRRQARELARARQERDEAETARRNTEEELQRRLRERAGEFDDARGVLPSRMTGPHLALKIAAAYALAGAVWILFSDYLLVSLVPEPDMINHLQTFKGWFFVLSTAALLAWGLERLLRGMREMEAKHRESEERFRLVVSGLKDCASCLLDRQGRVTSWNVGAQQLVGYHAPEILGHHFSCFYQPEDVASGRPAEALAMADERGRFVEEGWRVRKSGKRFWASIAITALRDELGRVRGFSSITRDMAEYRQVEDELHLANRALRAVSACHQAVHHASTESELLEEVCRVVVRICRYRLAWVGYAEHDEAKTVRPMAKAGYDQGYLDKASVTWADIERGRGPVGMAIRTGQHFVVQNISAEPFFAPWREEAIRRGYSSVLALPLTCQDRMLGALTIYATEPDAFDVEEVSLLTQLAADLAFGIGVLRDRAKQPKA